MSEQNNLQETEAIKKMREMAGNKTGLLCTFTGSTSIETRPMNTRDVDDSGNFWFLTDKHNNSVQQIKKLDKVQILYAFTDDAEFLSVEGHATLVSDPEKIEKYWSSFAKTWFRGGKDDPNIILIKVKPVDGYYWDTKNGKWVTMLKIAAGAVTGKEMDGGVEGTLEV